MTVVEERPAPPAAPPPKLPHRLWALLRNSWRQLTSMRTALVLLFLLAVAAMATTSGETSRAVTLSLAYSLGLGIPFVLFGLFFRRTLGIFRAVRRNSRWVTRVGGVLLILVGIALVTGGWNHFLVWLLTTFNFNGGTLL